MKPIRGTIAEYPRRTNHRKPYFRPETSFAKHNHDFGEVNRLAFCPACTPRCYARHGAKHRGR